MKNQRTHIHQRGVSIVELLVGVAIGLFIVGGAAKLFVDNLDSNRRLLLTTRVNQDLRAAADMVGRDVRRAGYWGNATDGLFGLDSSAVAANPHTTASGAISPVSAPASSVTYSYARNGDSALDSNEYAGFRLNADTGVGILEVQNGQDTWQALTDPATLDIQTFTVTPAVPAITNNLSKYCSCLKTLKCTQAQVDALTDPPLLTIARVTIELTGNAVSDTSVSRTLQQTVRVRNARLSGSCPT